MPCHVFSRPSAADLDAPPYASAQALHALRPRKQSFAPARPSDSRLTRSFLDLQAAGQANRELGAKLTRYAAALPLQPTHRKALVQSAAARNMEVGNYECAPLGF